MTLSRHVYTNRACEYVMRRKIDTFRRQLHHNLQEKERELRFKISVPLVEGMGPLHTKAQSRDKERLRSQLRRLLARRWGFEKQVASIQKFGTVGTLVTVNNLLDVCSEFYNVDSELCRQCGGIMTFDHVTFIQTCKLCQLSHLSIFAIEDKSQDLIVSKTGQATEQGAQEQRTTALEAVAAKRVPPSHKKDPVHHRTAAFRRYLSQFAVTRPEIPEDVMLMLYHELSYMHLMSSTKSRPATVADTLHVNGYSHLVPHAVRISRMYNGEPIPVLELDQMDRMVRMFTVLLRSFGDEKKRNLFVFEVLAALIFRAENRSDMVDVVLEHKSKVLSKLGDSKLVALIKRAKQTDPSFGWDGALLEREPTGCC